MQIRDLYISRKSTIVIMFILLAAFKIYAQPPANCGRYKPYLWIDRNDELRDDFIYNKKPLLDLAFNMPQPDQFYLGNFLGMMQYFEDQYKERYACLHIYFCAYTGKNYGRNPKDSNKLTLVFAPVEITPDGKNDIRYYHLPDGVPFDPSRARAFEISDVVFKSWHSHFAYRLLTKLNGTFDGLARGNQEDNKPSDTRAITYCKEHIRELIDEQLCPHTINGQPVTLTKDLSARFAVYGRDRARYKYPRRTFVLFDFVDDKGKMVELGDTDDFGNRDTSMVKCERCPTGIELEAIKGVDNGQLCPPSVNCPVYKPDPNDEKKYIKKVSKPSKR